MADTTFRHIPVLSKETAKLLITDKEGIYLDATLGGGGHSKYFLDLLGKKAMLIALDRDSQAIEIAKKNLADYKNQITFVQGNFADIKKIFNKLNITRINGSLLDLGLSSYQLGDDERGFSFNKNGPLDMRFDTGSPLTAKEIVNTWSYEQIRDTIKNYGGERFAAVIAGKIIEERQKCLIETTVQLKVLIEKNIRRSGKIHPATRTFQALRIAVNSELENIKKSLEDLLEFIITGGRVAVISYHSLEDRIVKHFFKKLASDGTWKPVNKKPIVPSENEIAENPRSRSAKLRVAEKIRGKIL